MAFGVVRGVGGDVCPSEIRLAIYIVLWGTCSEIYVAMMAPTVPTDTINPPETARTDGPAASKDHQNRALASIIYVFAHSLLRPHDRNAGPSGNAPEAAKNTAIYRRFGDSTETRMAYPVMVRSVHTTMYTPRLRWRSDSHATRTEKQHATAYGGTVKSCGGPPSSVCGGFLPPVGG